MAKKRIISVLAIMLAVILVLNSVWISAAQVSISRIGETSPSGVANDYLVDSTPYISEDTFQRMYEMLIIYQTPSDWKGYKEQAGVYVARKEYDKALDKIDKAIELSSSATDKENAQLWLQKGCLYTLKEEYEQAIDALETCVTYDPQNSESYLIMSQIYAEWENEEKTLVNMEKYLELNPGNAQTEKMLGQLYMARQDLASAKKWLLKAQESGDDAEAYYFYALCLLQENSYEEASTYLDITLELDQEIGDAYYYRAICRLTTGEYKKALEDLKTAQERTEDPELQKEIETLVNELKSV